MSDSIKRPPDPANPIDTRKKKGLTESDDAKDTGASVRDDATRALRSYGTTTTQTLYLAPRADTGPNDESGDHRRAGSALSRRAVRLLHQTACRVSYHRTIVTRNRKSRLAVAAVPPRTGVGTVKRRRSRQNVAWSSELENRSAWISEKQTHKRLFQNRWLHIRTPTF